MNTHTHAALRHATAYLPAAILTVAATLAAAAGWWLAGLTLAGISGLLYPRPAPTSEPGPAPAADEQPPYCTFVSCFRGEASDTETDGIYRLTTAVRIGNEALRQAHDLTRMWESAVGPEAPGLHRAAGELRQTLTLNTHASKAS